MVLQDVVDEKKFEITVSGSPEEIKALIYLINGRSGKGEGVEEINLALVSLDKGEEEVILDLSGIMRLILRKNGFLLISNTANPQFYFSTIKKAYLDSKKEYEENK